jgi:hypothetical protein
MALRRPTEPASVRLEAVIAIVAAFELTRWGLNEQYLVYLFAPLCLDVVVFHPQRRWLLVVLAVLATVYLVVNQTLLVPFLGVLGPQYLLGSPGAAPNPMPQPFRMLTLDSLAVLVSITLAQILWSMLRARAAPVPWIWRPFEWIARRATQHDHERHSRKNCQRLRQPSRWK